MSSNADFFRPSKLTNYHCSGCEIILDEKIEIFKILEKYGKKHDSNPNLCHCASRSGIVKNETWSSISIPQKKTHNPNKFFAHWPRVCIVLQENLHQSRVPLLCRLVQDRVPLAIQKFFPEKLRGQNSYGLSGALKRSPHHTTLGTNLINYAACVGLATDYNLQASRAFSGRCFQKITARSRFH